MSDFRQIKYDYAIFYPLLGIKVRGKLSHLMIFKEYWYGRRVDVYHYPYNPKTKKQQHWRDYLAMGASIWNTLPPETKAWYAKLRKPAQLYGYHRFLHFYLNQMSQFRE